MESRKTEVSRRGVFPNFWPKCEVSQILGEVVSTESGRSPEGARGVSRVIAKFFLMTDVLVEARSRYMEFLSQLGNNVTASSASDRIGHFEK